MPVSDPALGGVHKANPLGQSKASLRSVLPAGDLQVMGTCICLKMELHWKSNPIGKVRNNLPFFKEFAETNFTQKS